MSDTSLKHHFLLAMPQLSDPWFGHSLCYICEHNEHGAMGLVLNKPVGMTLAQVFSELGMASDSHGEDPVIQGGPVNPEQGFILYQDEKDWGQSMHVGDKTYLTTSKDMLEAIASGGAPDNVIVCLGYAGWDAGQLEEELANNSWLTIEADEHIIFNTNTHDQVDAAAKKLGIDMNLMTSDSGHA